MQLDGKWYNELGSLMDLTVDGGLVTGTYHTGVGEATGRYPITGAVDTDPIGHNQAVGLVVVWQNDQGSAHSVTTWSGQLQVIKGQEVLKTTWLLTRETKPDLDWQSTLVGTDIFLRQPPKEST